MRCLEGLYWGFLVLIGSTQRLRCKRPGCFGGEAQNSFPFGKCWKTWVFSGNSARKKNGRSGDGGKVVNAHSLRISARLNNLYWVMNSFFVVISYSFSIVLTFSDEVYVITFCVSTVKLLKTYSCWVSRRSRL